MMPGQDPAATASPQAVKNKLIASNGIRVNKCFFFIEFKLPSMS
jgi:hypothetical protein